MQDSESPVKSAPLKTPELGKKKSSVSLTPEDFTIKYTLGRGAYGSVFLVQKKLRQKAVCDEADTKGQAGERAQRKQMLSVLKHAAIIKLLYAFQDKKSLYFILEWCQGGQFLQFIKVNISSLSEQIKRFYIAQIVNILEYLHSNGVTHRDIKPQNLMLSNTGHLKVIDFGTAEISKCTLVPKAFKQKIQKMKEKAKLEEQKCEEQEPFQDQQSPRKKQRRSTFVGSCYYLSPELIQQNYCPPQADLWALGCIIYQLYYLQTPFKDTHEFAVYEKIKKCQLQFPANKQITENAVDLIKKLLRKNPDERLGSGKSPDLTYQKLKEHPYFAGLNIDQVFEEQVPQIELLKEPQPINQTQHHLQQKKQKTRTEFSKQMSLKLSSIIKELPTKKVLIHGLVEKKTFIKYSYYYLICYDDLSIERIKSEETQKRKLLKIDFDAPKMPALVVEKGRFQLNTVEKTYSFKCENNSQTWVNTINAQFRELSKSL